MPKSKQIGFLIEDTSASQLSFNLIKNINEYSKNSHDDFVVFFENSTASILNPNFSLMSSNSKSVIASLLLAILSYPLQE